MLQALSCPFLSGTADYANLMDLIYFVTTSSYPYSWRWEGRGRVWLLPAELIPGSVLKTISQVLELQPEYHYCCPSVAMEKWSKK